MTANPKNILLTIFIAAAAVACSDDDNHSSSGTEMVEMPISISIPAEGFVHPTDVAIGDEAVSPALAGTRTLPGDPGTSEQFLLPRYLYIYLVSTNSAGTAQVMFRKEEVRAEEWVLSTSSGNAVGQDHFSAADGLYVYQGHLSISLPLYRREGRVYVAASPVEIEGIPAETSSWTSADYVEDNVTFTVEGETRANLKDIYSSPCNLTKKVNGTDVYYGTIEDYASNMPHIDMVLYHVAARLDLLWNVEEAVQPAVALENITVSKLKRNGCLLFNPMGNALSPAELSSADGTYNETIILDKGTQWYGRKCLYIIPAQETKGQYTLHLDITKQSSSTPKSIETNINLKNGDPYTPWMRGFVTISTDF